MSAAASRLRLRLSFVLSSAVGQQQPVLYASTQRRGPVYRQFGRTFNYAPGVLEVVGKSPPCFRFQCFVIVVHSLELLCIARLAVGKRHGLHIFFLKHIAPGAVLTDCQNFVQVVRVIFHRPTLWRRDLLNVRSKQS